LISGWGFTLDPMGELTALPQIPLLVKEKGEGKTGKRKEGREVASS